jgi:N-acetylneuraminate synthase
MVFIVGEIGTNHCGSISIAKRIIESASKAGFDAVKFQKKDVEKIYNKEFLDAYLESPWGLTQRDMRLHREFSIKQYKELDKFCKKLKMPWFISCWNIDSQITMRQFKTKYNKIASAMLIHKKLLQLVAKERKPTFISTGMSTMKDIEQAVKIFRKEKCPFELLHAHSSYPMQHNEANLTLISKLQKKFKCNVGYSGHEGGAVNVSVPAVMLGATTIERHITIDRALYGHDQAASLEPDGMRRLIRDIRLIEEIMGDGKKRIYDSELPNIKKLRQNFV